LRKSDVRATTTMSTFNATEAASKIDPLPLAARRAVVVVTELRAAERLMAFEAAPIPWRTAPRND